MNVKLLRKIQKHILEKPRRFIMATFFVRKYGQQKTFISDGAAQRPVKFENCGTAACIGGWAVFLHDGLKTDPENIRARAIKLIGLKSPMGDELFEVGHWPAKFRDAYYIAKSQRSRARIAAQRIDHFIATKGAE